MRYLTVLAVFTLTFACSAASKVASHEHADGAESVASEQFRERCEAFEELVFGIEVSAALRGYAWVVDGTERRPLEGVQIAARETSSGKLKSVITGGDGEYELPGLPVGEYEVWTCLDGFDAVRFRLMLDPAATGERVDLYLRPAEAFGRVDVVVLGGSP